MCVCWVQGEEGASPTCSGFERVIEMQVTEAKRTEKPGEHRVLDTEERSFHKRGQTKQKVGGW